MFNDFEIRSMIKSIKEIIEKENYINFPSFRQTGRLDLKSKDYNFILDLNRKGHKRPKCTFQLRNKRNKEKPIVRVDIIGKSYLNPKGSFKWAGKEISCPHLHRADFPNYGTRVAVPLLEKNDNFQLDKTDLNNLGMCLRKTLKFLKVKNYDNYSIREQNNLF